MGRAPDNVVELSETLTLCEYKTGGHKGFWLWDETRGMNLAVRAETEVAALLHALEYYQGHLLAVEQEHRVLSQKVNSFLEQFAEED